MRILVFGRTGQVARELIRRAPAGISVTALGREAADLSDPAACAHAIEAADADVVINAAAYTAVDKAESEPRLAQTVNAEAPAAMAAATARRGLPFLQVSTDYVFDGTGNTPWRPGDATAPLSVYGRSKRDGEESVRAAGGPHLILRTSWVFSAHGANFVKTMLRLSETRDTLTIVADQIGGPTPAAAIADTALAMARALADDPGLSGTEHLSGAPDTSWAGFAREIFAQAGRATRVEEIPTAAYPTPARRPLNSRLDCTGLARFGLVRPDWRAHLAEVLTELEARA